MARKLKVYTTSLGFYDLAVAAPSMAAALRAWGTGENLFQQGFATEAEEKEIVAAAMAQPGVVLRRPVGSKTRFKEHSELPTAESLSEHLKRSEEPRKGTTASKPAPKDDRKAKRDSAEVTKRNADQRAERKAAAAFEKAERRRELQRQKKEAAEARARARRQTAVDKAKSALDEARRAHNEKTAAIEKELREVERRAKAEETRWRKLEHELQAALLKASR